MPPGLDTPVRLRKIQQKNFDRFDIDQSGTINTSDELMQLSLGLVCKLELRISGEELQEKVDSVRFHSPAVPTGLPVFGVVSRSPVVITAMRRRLIGMLVLVILSSCMISWYIFASTKEADQGRHATFSSATAIHSHHIHRDHNTPKRSENTSAAAANTFTERPNATASSSLTYTSLLTTISGSKNTTHIQQLPSPNTSLPPISFGACCGIGHRMGNNLRTAVYAISHSRPLHANWRAGHDAGVTWNVLFNDTRYIKQGPTAKEHYANIIPENWSSSPLAWTEPIEQHPGSTTVYHRYSKFHMMFEMPLAQTIVKMLAENLSTLVLSYLQPMREQYSKSDLHLCVHVREGNNETGNWQRKKWRHIPLENTLNHTLQSMQNFALSNSASNSSKVSLFVASDTTKALSWFEKNSPANWHIVKPKKEFPRPETGVWFGEHGSQTQKNLTQDQLNEAMGATAADVFALGECSALFIPTYSSFSVVGIVMTRAKRNRVFFMERSG